jgi:hypothetical protein
MLCILLNLEDILISFKDIHLNGYHVETTDEGSDEYLYFTSIILV